MTGFVFTFSLFCTALLQSDPAILQHVELAPMRQIIDAVMPEVMPPAGRHKLVPPSHPHQTPSTQPAILPLHRCDGSSVSAVRLSRVRRARPIRAPSVVVAL